MVDSTATVGSIVSSTVGKMAPVAGRAASAAKGLTHWQRTLATVGVVGLVLVIARLAIKRGSESDRDKRSAGKTVNRIVDSVFIYSVMGLLVLTLVQQMRFAYKVILQKKSFGAAATEVSMGSSSSSNEEIFSAFTGSDMNL